MDDTLFVDTAVPIRRDGLIFMFSPHTADDFLSNYLEKRILHVDRKTPAYFDEIYGVTDVEDALIVGSREPEHFALVKVAGGELAVDDFTFERPSVRWRLTGKGPTKWIDARKVVSHFADGYTVIIKDAALFNARLQRFCNRLQTDLGAFVQPNVYYTPPNAQGFQVHHDTHDTLTAQIQGEKTWRIYAPLVELPLESQPFRSGAKADGLRLVREVRLSAGDTLYIPRGFPHEAVTSGSPSLHVTFALAPIRVTDVLDYVMRIAGDRDLELRRSLHPEMLGMDDLAKRFGAFFQSRLTETFSAERLQLALEIALNELFRITRSNANGAFDQALRLSALGPKTRLRIDDSIPFMIRERESTVDLLIAGKSLGFPKLCKAALTRLQQGPAALDELDAGLSQQNRDLLVKMLVLEGLALIED